MKYNDSNKPLVCMLTESACYKGTKPMDVWGVLWHSTGANNPTLKRYVQPADKDPQHDELLELIGINRYGNDYNHKGKSRQMGVNAWIGQLADGTMATIQTMPWDYAPWGCGAGNKGSCNAHWIQFETCEDALTDPEYAMRAYEESCELTAYLCKMFNIDPFATVRFKGVDVPTILSHKDSALLGLGCNHGDVAHWYPKLIGKTMDDVRADVAKLLGEDTGTVSVKPAVPGTPANAYATSLLGKRIIRMGSKGDDVVELQEKLMRLGYKLPKYGADGDCGSETVKAIMDFQKANGLVQDGEFGPLSLAKLNELLKTQETEPAAQEAEPVANASFGLKVTGSTVNVRTAPSTATGKIMYVVKKGETLTAVGTDAATGWYKLADGNFICNQYASKT